MIYWNGIKYHFERHKWKYFIASIQFILLLLGIIFTAVGSHENNTSIVALGILLLITNGMWICTYICKLICCPNTNCCCEEYEWQTYDHV